MKKDNLKNKALGELISLNKIGVISILKKYNIKPESNSNTDVSIALVEGLKNDYVAAEIIELMKLITVNNKYSNADGDADGDEVSGYIDAALKGISTITNAWTTNTNTKSQAEIQAAQIAANANMFNTNKIQEKKLSQGAIIGIIFGGLVLLIGGTILIVKVAKK